MNNDFPKDKLINTKLLYPKIYDNIELLWGYPELKGYLNKIIVNNRTHRKGFEPIVLEEFVLLDSMTEDNKPTNVWDINFYN